MQPSSRQENLLQHALSLHGAGQLEQAKKLYEQILANEPENAEVLRLLGTAEYQLGRREECVRFLDKSLALSPAQPETLFNLGTALSELERNEEALAAYDKALVLKPGYAEAHYNRANILLKLEHFEEAIAGYDKAIAIKPGYAKAHFNRGVALTKVERFADALASYDQALALQPNYMEALRKKAGLLWTLKRLDEALRCFERITEAKPDDSSAWRDRAHLLWDLDRLQDCLGCLNQLTSLEPNSSWAWYTKAVLLATLGDYYGTLECLEKLQSLDTDYEEVLGEILVYRGHLGLWDGFHSQRERILNGIARNKKMSTAFNVMAFVDSPQIQRSAAEISARKYPPGKALPSLTKHRRHERIRVGYFSSDFGDHPVSHLMAGVLGHHDRSRFEIFAFAFGPDRQHEPWRQRIVDGVEHFLDVRLNSALEIAELARRHEIDIAIDLNGFTRDCKTGIFAERAAPVQASYIGYLGTMGAPYIDYLIADPIIIPEDKRSFYTEKIVSLPSYQANDDRMPISERVFTRAELGLPEQAFVFCSFNNTYKITPDVFDSWMRILKRVPNSVLWLYASHPGAIPNLKREAEARGVSGERLVFAAKIPLEEHLARQRLADLFLDTHPYNAGATASNALRVGLPVLTRLGESFPARMGASILTAAGIPELVTHSVEEYEALAAALATDRERLSAIRQTLMASLPTCALFDTARFTRSLEAAYAAMYERNQNDLPPDHIEVAKSHN